MIRKKSYPKDILRLFFIGVLPFLTLVIGFQNCGKRPAVIFDETAELEERFSDDGVIEDEDTSPPIVVDPEACSQINACQLSSTIAEPGPDQTFTLRVSTNLDNDPQFSYCKNDLRYIWYGRYTSTGSSTNKNEAFNGTDIRYSSTPVPDPLNVPFRYVNFVAKPSGSMVVLKEPGTYVRSVVIQDRLGNQLCRTNEVSTRVIPFCLLTGPSTATAGQNVIYNFTQDLNYPPTSQIVKRLWTSQLIDQNQNVSNEFIDRNYEPDPNGTTFTLTLAGNLSGRITRSVKGVDANNKIGCLSNQVSTVVTATTTTTTTRPPTTTTTVPAEQLLTCGAAYYKKSDNSVCIDGQIVAAGNWIIFGNHSYQQNDPDGTWATLQKREFAVDNYLCETRTEAYFDDHGFVKILKNNDESIGLWSRLNTACSSNNCRNKSNQACSPWEAPRKSGDTIDWCLPMITSGDGNATNNNQAIPMKLKPNERLTVYSTHTIGRSGDRHEYRVGVRLCTRSEIATFP